MTGTLIVVGVGPGDPELMTVKAARAIAAAPVVAYFAKHGRRGHARTIADTYLAPGARELRLEYPYTTEIALDDPRYAEGFATFYAQCAARLAEELDGGADVALLCEGDPFLYGSSLPLLDRLSQSHATTVIPGVCGMSGCWTAARLPMTHGDDVLSVIPGTLDEASLAAALSGCDAAVVMKIGRNLDKVRAALARTGRAEQAIYVERGTMSGERTMPLREFRDAPAPYFSLVLVPGRRRAR